MIPPERKQFWMLVLKHVTMIDPYMEIHQNWIVYTLESTDSYWQNIYAEAPLIWVSGWIALLIKKPPQNFWKRTRFLVNRKYIRRFGIYRRLQGVLKKSFLRAFFFLKEICQRVPASYNIPIIRDATTHPFEHSWVSLLMFQWFSFIYNYCA